MSSLTALFNVTHQICKKTFLWKHTTNFCVFFLIILLYMYFYYSIYRYYIYYAMSFAIMELIEFTRIRKSVLMHLFSLCCFLVFLLLLNSKLWFSMWYSKFETGELHLILKKKNLHANSFFLHKKELTEITKYFWF